MAKIRLTASDSRTFLCVATTYIPVFKDPTAKRGNKRYMWHWYLNHSRSDRWDRRYQGGTSDSNGKFNGNMMSLFWFRENENGRTLRQCISNIGVDKITKITLKLTSGGTFGGYQYTDFNIVSGSSWDDSYLYDQSGDSYGTTRTTHLKQQRINLGAHSYIDLTAYKSTIANNETLGLFRPGSYNNGLYYGWVYGHDSKHNASLRPYVEIEYSENAPPHSPNVSSTAHGQNGYYKADSFHFDVTSNGDPDNNIHAQPYSCEVFDSRGNKLASTGWQSGTNFRFNASSYRGDSLKVVGYVRDSIGLQATSEKVFHMNSLPYWQNYGSENNAITFNSGVHNGVFKGDVRLSWPAATDKENKGNVKYALYAQIGSDNGPYGDNGNTVVAYNLTTNSHTLNPAQLGDRVVQKGERVYFSVWASDGLEYSSYRLVSSWIAREATPAGLTDVYPSKGGFKNEVTVSWKAPNLQPGVTVDHYKVHLLKDNGELVRTYTTKETEYVCRDLHLFEDGEHFKFKVSTVTNLGSESSASFSGRLRKKTPPAPPIFKVTKFIKNEWLAVDVNSPGPDEDGDPVIVGLIESTQIVTNHEHRFGPFGGSLISLLYKREDGDFKHLRSFSENIHGDRTYGETFFTRIDRNKPPSTGSITFPKNNSTVYSNTPRIIFRTGTDDKSGYLYVTITINGKSYSSRNSSYFDDTSYRESSTGVFVVPKEAALKPGKNSISIKMYDGEYYGSSTSINVKYANMPFERKNKGDLITAKDTNILKSMINANRNAYGLSQLNIIDAQPGIYINNQYLRNEFNSLSELNKFINDKTKKNSLKRKYSFPKINDLISVDLINTICKMIKEP